MALMESIVGIWWLARALLLRLTRRREDGATSNREVSLIAAVAMVILYLLTAILNLLGAMLGLRKA
jgi:hypothetical protein